MGVIKTTEFQQADILRLEAELNNLWGELNTSNIPHAIRTECEETLGECEENFKAALSGQASFNELESKLNQCDLKLAQAAVKQAENEISKSEHGSSHFQALENVRKGLEAQEITPIRARHEVKQIMRHQG